MDIEISIGENHNVALREVLCIYRGDHGGSFVTRHDVIPGEPPTLGVGELLTMDTVQSLARSLGGLAAAEVLPENVISRTDRMTAWWTPAQKHQMFFEDQESTLSKISGRMFPQPPLLFKASDGNLAIRALSSSKRPTAKTPLMVAPYWNTDSEGVVCMGTARIPTDCSPATMPEWCRAFWESAFTHAGVGVRITKHPSGFEGLWEELVERKSGFPAKYLVRAKQSLLDFLRDGETQ